MEVDRVIRYAKLPDSKLAKPGARTSKEVIEETKVEIHNTARRELSGIPSMDEEEIDALVGIQYDLLEYSLGWKYSYSREEYNEFIEDSLNVFFNIFCERYKRSMREDELSQVLIATQTSLLRFLNDNSDKVAVAVKVLGLYPDRTVLKISSE
jgi:hypothetical protein